MTTWFTADQHFGHRNIIGYCGRPFRSVDEMDEALIERWNSRVAATDTVWVLGDFAMGPIEHTLAIIGRLNGSATLVAGNHDRCWHGHHDRAIRWVERYLDAGFDNIVQGSALVDIAGTTVVVDHFPYRGDSHDTDRYVGARPVDEGGWLLHGHVHTRWAERDRMINVGVDVRGYAPMADSEVAAIIERALVDA